MGATPSLIYRTSDMNSPLTFAPSRRSPAHRRLRAGWWAVLAAVGCGLAGCSDPDMVSVQLSSRAVEELGASHLEITAQVAGDQVGLRYQWFSVAGACDPQTTDKPTTTFKFADGTTRDRVAVEAWRGNKRVGRGELNVRLDETAGRLTSGEPTPAVSITITSVPPYEPQGGPDTHADIAGTVGGSLSPGYSVVLYARASDVWYIQPIAYAAHEIHPDNTWTSWTHTGSSYAALVVRPGFEPVPRLDVLPKVGGYVVARAVVEGTKK